MHAYESKQLLIRFTLICSLVRNIVVRIVSTCTS